MINWIKRKLGLHIHEWTKWGEPYLKHVAGYVDVHGDRVKGYDYYGQNRECKTCGDIQFKRHL